ncbi:MAG: hypothetical protein ABJA81_02625 [Nocardioidaceae bacterium]
MRDTPVLGPHDVWLIEEFELLHAVIAAAVSTERFSQADVDVVLGVPARIPDQRHGT